MYDNEELLDKLKKAHYLTFNLTQSASFDEVKKEWFRLSKVYNREMNQSKDDETKKVFENQLKNLNDSYEYIKNLCNPRPKVEHFHNTEEYDVNEKRDKQRQDENKKEIQYNALLWQKAIAKSEYQFRTLAKQFRDLGNYKNALMLATECEDIAGKIKAEREQDKTEEQREWQPERAKECEDIANKSKGIKHIVNILRPILIVPLCMFTLFIIAMIGSKITIIIIIIILMVVLIKKIL